jgi:hypothetical protein
MASTLLAAGLVLSACGGSSDATSTTSAPPKSTVPTTTPTTTPASTAPPTTVPSNVPVSASHRMFAFYYLWWDTAHWHARLGPAYPYGAQPLPLPVTLSGDGCTVQNDFAGNQLTDVSSPLFTQDDYSQILSDVTLAAHSGLAGFAVSWAGTGKPGQTASSSAFNARLAMVVKAVHQVNSQGIPFSLWIAYISSAAIRTNDYINNDLTYLESTYGKDSAFDRGNDGRPTLILMGSRKYPDSFLSAFSAQWRPHFYLVGDENWNTWSSAKAADFDADQYYWSSQNPVKNPSSFKNIEKLAAEVRATRNPDGSVKKFFSPLAPGYNKVIGGGSGCVPRLAGQTMKDIFTGNSAANPDGWMVISWNEIDEGTYIMPLERYGMQSVNTLTSIINAPTTGGS